MKQILSMNYAMIGTDILSHPSTIFTNDNIDVSIFTTETELITFIAGSNATYPPLPNVGEWCEMNKIYAYGANKVKCLQSHNRMNYTPEQTPALFLIILTVAGYPVWVQPTGAHDAYNIGDRVHFPNANSPVYESKINANVWSPTAYPAGWQLIP